jgi:hypothetical protein
MKTKERKTVFIFCPYPIDNPLHGNEARTKEMVDHLRKIGFKCVPFIYVVDRISHASDFSRIRLDSLFEDWFFHDGQTLHSSEPNYSETQRTDALHYVGWLFRSALNIFRNGFRIAHLQKNYLPLKVSKAVSNILKEKKYDALITSYVWTTNIFALCPTNTKKILDLHDIFSQSKSSTNPNLPSPDFEWLKYQSEVALMKSADLLICIQKEEHSFVSSQLPDKSVIVVGYSPIEKVLPAANNLNVGTIGSFNTSNVGGLEFFLSAVWPIVLSEVPDAVLLVAGNQSKALTFQHPSIKSLGMIDNLESFYNNCSLIINCSIGGSGLKIKTVEAISFGRNIVTWPSGANGVQFGMERIHIVPNPRQFALKIVDVLLLPAKYSIKSLGYSSEENYSPLVRNINGNE